MGYIALGLTIGQILQMFIGICHFASDESKWKTNGVNKDNMKERDMMISIDSMYQVPAEMIPDRYKLALVSNQSKRKLFFD